MHQYRMHEAKTNLSKLVQQALAGEEVIIAKGNQPLVKIVPLDQSTRERRLGTAKGKIHMKVDFDEPLQDFSAYVP